MARPARPAGAPGTTRVERSDARSDSQEAKAAGEARVSGEPKPAGEPRGGAPGAGEDPGPRGGEPA
jgi:hypothetical protein